MIAHGGHRIMDLMGHAAYTAYAAHHEVLPWPRVREAFAQAALAAAGGWGPCDTFDDWAEANGYANEYARDHGHADLLAAFEAGARSALAESVPAVAPAQPAPELAARPRPRVDWARVSEAVADRERERDEARADRDRLHNALFVIGKMIPAVGGASADECRKISEVVWAVVHNRDGQPQPAPGDELAQLRELLRLSRRLVVTLRRISSQQDAAGHADSAYATGCAATMVEALWPVCNEQCTDSVHHHQPGPQPAPEPECPCQCHGDTLSGIHGTCRLPPEPQPASEQELR